MAISADLDQDQEIDGPSKYLLHRNQSFIEIFSKGQIEGSSPFLDFHSIGETYSQLNRRPLFS